MHIIESRLASGNTAPATACAWTVPTASPPRKFAKATPDLLADATLASSEKLLLLALAMDDWKPAADRYYPSNADLAKSIGLKPRTVQMLLASLERKARIRIEPGRNPTHRVIHRLGGSSEVPPRIQPTPSTDATSKTVPLPRTPLRPPHVEECAPTRATDCAHLRPLPLDNTLDPSQDGKRESISTNGNGNGATTKSREAHPATLP